MQTSDAHLNDESSLMLPRAFSSKSHDRAGSEISTSGFMNFIKASCKCLKTASSNYHVNNLPLGCLEFIAGGGDIWTHEDDTFKVFFLKQYSALASNTQYIESSVKDANHCSKKGRTEDLQSNIAVHRGGILDDVCSRGRELMLSSRVISSQIKQNNPSSEDSDDSSDNDEHDDKAGQNMDIFTGKLRGNAKTQATLEVVDMRFKLLDAARSDENEKVVLQQMKNNAMEGFGCTRRERQAKLFQEQLKKGLEQRERNLKKRGKASTDKASEETSGKALAIVQYEVTPYMKKQVQFGKIVAATHLQLMQQECDARGIAFEEEKYKNMISKLREAVKSDERKRLQLNPKAKLKHFLPLGEKDFSKWQMD